MGHGVDDLFGGREENRAVIEPEGPDPFSIKFGLYDDGPRVPAQEAPLLEGIAEEDARSFASEGCKGPVDVIILHQCLFPPL